MAAAGPWAGHETSPRRMAAYLVALRPILASAMVGWEGWVRRIGALGEDVRHGNAALVAHGAGRIGREQIVVFRDARAQIERLEPPPQCRACQRALTSWLEALVDACELLVSVGVTGELGRIRDTRHHLEIGRVHAREFNAEYARLAAELRARVAALQPRPRRPARR